MVEGRWITCSGFANRASSCDAFWERGERARFFVGRLERGSAEVGILSGIASDIWRSVEREVKVRVLTQADALLLCSAPLVGCFLDQKAVRIAKSLLDQKPMHRCV